MRCFARRETVIRELKDRFRLELSDKECIAFVGDLIKQSARNWTTGVCYFYLFILFLLFFIIIFCFYYLFFIIYFLLFIFCYFFVFIIYFLIFFVNFY